MLADQPAAEYVRCHLLPHHLDDLRKSGLTDDTIIHPLGSRLLAKITIRKLLRVQT